MRIYDIIASKRDGKELTDEEIAFFVKGYTNGDIDDSQAAALMMAIYLNGMTKEETVTLTNEMAHSGDMLDLSDIGGITVDKHSTGGVGDKTTLIVIPIVASLGLKAAKMSGRGLGHTGGTVDKLESINGFDTAISPEEFKAQVRNISAAVVGQTGRLAPADKKIYKLRDHTATVGCIPLIASSIMSKKLAAGAQCIVLDVKTGSGAFMKTLEGSVELAKSMVEIGNASGRKTAALITDMDTPLGTHIGNALEVEEAVRVLRGETDNDLLNVSLALAAEIVSLAFSLTSDEAMSKCCEALKSGKALNKFKELVEAQHGDSAFIDDLTLLPHAKTKVEVRSRTRGYISHIDAEKIGLTALLLGAGRAGEKDEIDHSAGLILHKKTGDCINEGDILCELLTSTRDTVSAQNAFYDAIEISSVPPEKKPLIYTTIR